MATIHLRLCFFSAAILAYFLPSFGQAQTFTKIGATCGIPTHVNGGQAPFGIHLIDIDGDGTLDFYTTSHSNNPVSGPGKAFLNDGQGHFTPAPGVYPQSEIYFHYDINNDGKTDWACRNGDGPAVWMINHSTPGHPNFTRSDSRTSGEGRAQAVLDWNKDGKADWILGDRPGIKVLLNDGTPAVYKSGAPDVTIDLGMGARTQATPAVILVDVDGDGDIDLLTEWGQYWTPGDKSLLINDGKMNFTDGTAAAGLPTSGFHIKRAADVNHDGFVDIIALQNKSLVIYLNDGKGHFTLKPNAVDVPGGISEDSWGIAVMTDIDNDGVGDLIVDAKWTLKVLRGTGGGSFTQMNAAWGIAFGAGGDAGNCFGDIDGDGDLDIAGYTGAGKADIEMYRNDLPAKNWMNVRVIGAGANRGAPGAKIRLFKPGTDSLLWYEQVVINGHQDDQSYYDYGTTERHYGLNTRANCDVEVEFYPSGKKVKSANLAANKTWVFNEDGTVSELALRGAGAGATSAATRPAQP